MNISYEQVIKAAHYHNSESEKILDVLKRAFLNSESRFLDVGFGKGKYLTLARKIGYNIYGIDINSEYVAEAKRQGYNCYHTSEADLLAKERFDVILISHVIEHLDPTSLKSMLEMYSNLLSAQGRLIIASPLLTDRFFYDFTHVRPYYPQSIWHAFGANTDEISSGRSGFTLELNDVFFIKDSFRTRKLRSYYIKDGLGVQFFLTRCINYALALLYFVSNGQIGVRASWIGVYKRTVLNSR